MRLSTSVFTAIVAILLTPAAAVASTLWNWNYSAPGISAGGTLTTVDSPDPSGGYLITGIMGDRNGEAITGLQPAGTAIPGNEPFAVDDLVFLGSGPQLTGNGFGFSTADGSFANPFYADFLPMPGYLEFFSAPSFTTELPVEFSAMPVAAPEPASVVLVCAALALISFRWRDSRRASFARRPAAI